MPNAWLKGQLGASDIIAKFLEISFQGKEI
jgi:hypothetical protein